MVTGIVAFAAAATAVFVITFILCIHKPNTNNLPDIDELYKDLD